MAKNIKIKNYYFTLINKNTKRGQQIIRAYDYAYINRPYAELSYVYYNYSIYKERAFEYCMNLYNGMGGYNRTITGANCMTFSFAFKVDVNNKTYLIYITKSDKYAIEL